MRALLILLVVLCYNFKVIAQDDAVITTTVSDTAVKPEKAIKNPKKAALLSAVIPGAGQIYNGKYWKLPLVYGGIGTAGYFILSNRSNYKTFKNYYLLDSDPDTTLKSPYYLSVQPEALKQQADQFRSWMEYSYLAFAAVYILQIVDASVDAHLSGFDVSDDLTMHIEPAILTAQGRGHINGLSLRLTF